MASWHSQPAYQAPASGLHERHNVMGYPNETTAVHNALSQPQQHQPYRAQSQQVPNSTPQQVSPYQQPTTFTSSASYKFPSRSNAWSDRVAPPQTVSPVSGVLGLPPQQAGSSVLGTGTGYGEKFGVQVGSTWAKPEAGTGSGWANPDTDSASGWSHGGTSGMFPNPAPAFVPQKFDGDTEVAQQLRPSGSIFKPQASVATPGLWRPPLQLLDARPSAQPMQGVGDLHEGGFDALQGGFDPRGGGFDPREREFERLPLNVNVNAFGGPPRLSPPRRGLLSDSGRPGHHGLGGDFGKFGHRDSLEDPFVLEQRPLLPPLERTGPGGPMFRRGPPSPEHFREFGINPPHPGFRPAHFIDGPPSMPSRGPGFGYRPRGPWVPDAPPIQPQGQKRSWHQTNDSRFQKPSVEPRAKKPMLPHRKQSAAHAASPGWCELCKVDCGRPEDLRTHLKGKQHQKKVQLVAEIKKAEVEAKAQTESAEGGEQTKCLICGVQCTSFLNLREHRIGKKHKREVERLRGMGKFVDDSDPRDMLEALAALGQSNVKEGGLSVAAQTGAAGAASGAPENMTQTNADAEIPEKLGELMKAAVAEGVVTRVEKNWMCVSCAILCNHHNMLELHLSGKKHASKVAADKERKEQEMKGDLESNNLTKTQIRARRRFRKAIREAELARAERNAKYLEVIAKDGRFQGEAGKGRAGDREAAVVAASGSEAVEASREIHVSIGRLELANFLKQQFSSLLGEVECVSLPFRPFIVYPEDNLLPDNVKDPVAAAALKERRKAEKQKSDICFSIRFPEAETTNKLVSMKKLEIPMQNLPVQISTFPPTTTAGISARETIPSQSSAPSTVPSEPAAPVTILDQSELTPAVPSQSATPAVVAPTGAVDEPLQILTSSAMDEESPIPSGRFDLNATACDENSKEDLDVSV